MANRPIRPLGVIFNSRLARRVLRLLVSGFADHVLSPRTVAAIMFDLARARARASRVTPGRPETRLHLGCGGRKVPGWLNVDIEHSDQDVDLASGKLPWPDDTFSVIVSQHVIEHLELEAELLPLLAELGRVAKPGAELWLSTPNLERVCNSYREHRGKDLLLDRRKRYPDFKLVPAGVPTQHMINALFHQDGEHKNLFDPEMLDWMLRHAGFGDCTVVTERQLLDRMPEFPVRGDDYQTVYVRAIAAEPIRGAC